MVWNLRASENSEMRAFAKATRTDSEVALLQSIKNQVPVENLSLYVHNVLNLSNKKKVSTGGKILPDSKVKNFFNSECDHYICTNWSFRTVSSDRKAKLQRKGIEA